MKKLIVCFALLSLTACKKHASYTDVKLADGKPGLIMKCPDDMTGNDCLLDANDFCQGAATLIASELNNDKSLYLISCHQK